MNKQKSLKSIIISISLALILAMGIIGLPIKATCEVLAAYIPESVQIVNGSFQSTENTTTVDGYNITLPDGWVVAPDAEYSDAVTVSITDNEAKSLKIGADSDAKFGIRQNQTSTFLQGSYYRITVDITTTVTATASVYLTGSNKYTCLSTNTNGEKQTVLIYFETGHNTDEYLSLELWLGTKESTTTGNVEFDNISIYKVSPTEYMSKNGQEGCYHISAKAIVTPTGLNNNTLFNGAYTPINTEDWSWKVKETENATDLSLSLVHEYEELIEYTNHYTGNTVPVLKLNTYSIYEDVDGHGLNRTVMYIDNNRLYFDYENEQYIHEVPFELITKYYDDGDHQLTLKEDNKYYDNNNIEYLGVVTTRYFAKVNNSEMALTQISGSKYYTTDYALTVYTYDDVDAEDKTFYLTATPSDVTFSYNSTKANNYILKLKNSNADKILTAVSPNFTIEQFAYYRLSLYAKTNSFKGDTKSAMSINLVANQHTGAHPSGTVKETSVYANPYSTTLDITNDWVEYVFYIKGSPISSNNEVSLQFAVNSGSTIYVSNIELTRINYEGISDQTNIFDLGTNKDGETLLATDTIANGNFNNYTTVDYDNAGNTKYPIKPSGLTQIGTLNGINSASGIVPTNALYNNAKAEIGNVNNPGAENLNVLAIYASSTENYGYKTGNITLNSNSYYIITFDVYTDNAFTGSVYSKLYFDDIVVANLSDIISTDSWTTYTYYIKTSSSSQPVSLEFGVADATNTCFFKNLTYKSINEALFKEKSQKNIDDATTPISIAEQKTNHYMYVDASEENFSFITYNYTNSSNKLYSSYTYTTSTDSTGIVGVIDTTDTFAGTIFADIAKLDFPASKTNNVLVLYNSSAAEFTKVSQVFGKTLSANTYYKVSIWLKTKDIEEGKGLDIVIKETGKADEDNPMTIHFENINTAGYTDNENNDYKEYVAYIKTGTTAPNSITMDIAFGNNEASSSGYVFIGKIAYQDSNKKEYKNAQKSNEINGGNAQFVDLSNTASQNSSTKDKENKTDAVMIFFVVFSSLALVGTLIVAMVMIFIKKMPKAKKKVKAKKISTADGDRQKGGFV